MIRPWKIQVSLNILNKRVFFQSLIFALCVTGFSAHSADSDDQTYLARNSINSGDNSINIIASQQSKVVVLFDQNNNPRTVSRDSILSYLERNAIDKISEANAKFPNLYGSTWKTAQIANYLFSIGQYSASAQLFDEATQLAGENKAAYTALEGMATAGYYGSKRHVQGLRFICRRYAFRPSWDFRFRHAIHAHLRSIATNLGLDYAEQVVEHLRRDPNCRRDDFTKSWIPIHLTDMRWLESSVPPGRANYGFSSDADARLARRLVSEGSHGFTDYLLFIRGDYAEIVQQYPNSYVRDLALLGVGATETGPRAIAALEAYLDNYRTHQVYAAQLLFKNIAKENDQRKQISLMQRYGDAIFDANNESSIYFQINDHTRIWFYGSSAKTFTINQIAAITSYYEKCPSLLDHMHNGKFRTVYKSVDNALNLHDKVFTDDISMNGFFGNRGDSDYTGRCIVEFQERDLISLKKGVLEPLIFAIDSQDPEQIFALGQAFKICGDFRQGKHDFLKENLDLENPDAWCAQNKYRFPKLSFHRISANLLRAANELDPIGRGDALFLAGLALRNAHQYEDYLGVVQEYIAAYPDGVFADDSLTEVGWFHLTISNDLGLADRYFEQVIRKFPGRNSYDNALNWLAISALQQGKYQKSLAYSSMLLQSVGRSRFRAIAEARIFNIRNAR